MDLLHEGVKIGEHLFGRLAVHEVIAARLQGDDARFNTMSTIKADSELAWC